MPRISQLRSARAELRIKRRVVFIIFALIPEDTSCRIARDRQKHLLKQRAGTVFLWYGPIGMTGFGTRLHTPQLLCAVKPVHNGAPLGLVRSVCLKRPSPPVSRRHSFAVCP